MVRRHGDRVWAICRSIAQLVCRTPRCVRTARCRVPRRGRRRDGRSTVWETMLRYRTSRAWRLLVVDLALAPTSTPPCSVARSIGTGPMPTGADDRQFGKDPTSLEPLGAACTSPSSCARRR
ncbi:MAG: hypothetical protein R2713_00100 [Ilumatobacteraceae bacterium]